MLLSAKKGKGGPEHRLLWQKPVRKGTGALPPVA
jgi:hypothetical protein